MNSPLRSAVWLGVVAIASLAIAFASAALQRAGLSPIVLSSVLVGAACGAAGLVAALVLEIQNRRLLVAGMVAAALLTVALQHVFLYRNYEHGWEQAQLKEPQLALFRDPPPDSLVKYLRQEAVGGRAWLWLLDGAIVTATAVGIVAGVRRDRGEASMK